MFSTLTYQNAMSWAVPWVAALSPVIILIAAICLAMWLADWLLSLFGVNRSSGGQDGASSTSGPVGGSAGGGRGLPSAPRSSSASYRGDPEYGPDQDRASIAEWEMLEENARK